MPEGGPSLKHPISAYQPLLSNVKTSSVVFRHLLRALLREATYLPDPAARSYYRSSIVNRFRSHRAKQKGPVHHGLYTESPWRADISLLKKQSRPFEKQKYLLLKGRQELRDLARANLGHMLPLMKVLMHTYGRSGKRRAQLLDSFWAECVNSSQHNTLSDTKGVEERLQELRKPPRPKVPELPDKMQALLAGQIVSGLDPQWSKLELKPNLEEKNIWRRSMPTNRQINKIKRWEVEVRGRLLPPLPQAEYDRLVKLTSHHADLNKKYHVLKQPQRRAMGKETSRGVWRPAHLPEESSDRHKFDDAISDLINTDKVHRLSERFMRRCLQRILDMTPTFELSPGGQWMVRFGRGEEEWVKAYNQFRCEASSGRVPEQERIPAKKSWMFQLDEGADEPTFRKMKRKGISSQ